MKHVTAVLELEDESRPRTVDREVLAAADALAHLLAVDTQRLPVPAGPASDRLQLVLKALAPDDVAAAVLSAKGPDPVCWEVITHVGIPVVVVPRASRRTIRRFSRVLLPMDGTRAAAVAVADLAQHALDAGVAVVATHVFDVATVPAFWDQAAHSGREWTEEFVRRCLPDGVELDLRRGRPCEEVLAEADRTDVDLIIIGWGQDLSAGRAATVRQALTHGRVPVLLVPEGVEDDPSPRSPARALPDPDLV